MTDYAPWLKTFVKADSGPLLGDAMTDYLNKKEVRDALHITDGTFTWSSCDTTISTNYIQ